MRRACALMRAIRQSAPRYKNRVYLRKHKYTLLTGGSKITDYIVKPLETDTS